MKVLLVSENPETRARLESLFEPGWEFIHYLSPIKAMDNIDEIEPDVILFNAMDFPRHWKPFLTFLRETRDRKATVFILMRGNLFPVTEASKAAFLDANGIIDASLDAESVRNAREIIERYKGLPADSNEAEESAASREEPFEAQRESGSPVLRPGPGNRVGLMFAHPENGKLVTGTVRELSGERIEFVLDRYSTGTAFRSGRLVRDASLRLGNTIMTLNLEVAASGDDAVVLRIPRTEVGREKILEYILTEA